MYVYVYAYAYVRIPPHRTFHLLRSDRIRRVEDLTAYSISKREGERENERRRGGREKERDRERGMDGGRERERDMRMRMRMRAEVRCGAVCPWRAYLCVGVFGFDAIGEVADAFRMAAAARPVDELLRRPNGRQSGKWMARRTGRTDRRGADGEGQRETEKDRMRDREREGERQRETGGETERATERDRDRERPTPDL